jgi:hypothetical protein
MGKKSELYKIKMDRVLQFRVDKVMCGLPKSVIDLGADRKYLIPYIQHIPSEVDRVQHEFLVICREVLGIKYKDGEYVNKHGIIGRYIDDSGNASLHLGWHRFMCMDEGYREWIQPYYAVNTEKYNISECTCINDKYPELVDYFVCRQRDKKLDILLEG